MYTRNTRSINKIAMNDISFGPAAVIVQIVFCLLQRYDINPNVERTNIL